NAQLVQGVLISDSLAAPDGRDVRCCGEAGVGHSRHARRCRSGFRQAKRGDMWSG
ncbi:unnamed protein product, partial [Ectocarpus sp. 13 AM-2016]